MRESVREEAPQESPLPEARPTRHLEVTVDTIRIHDRDDTLDAHYSGLERLDAPHGCYEGLVFIGHLTEVDGEEVESMEAVPCRRCARS